MIYLASDHGGYKLKQQLKTFLNQQKLDYKDLGPAKFKDGDDYVDYAVRVAKQVAKNPLTNLGVLLCRSGQGVCIVANKFKGVRAVTVWNESLAYYSRNDDMANILCLPSDHISLVEAKKIVKTWLQTPYSSESRHMRRVRKISKLEDGL